jgi:hypothetical protein
MGMGMKPVKPLFFGSTSLTEAVLGFMCGFLGEAILF